MLLKLLKRLLVLSIFIIYIPLFLAIGLLWAVFVIIANIVIISLIQITKVLK